MKIFKRIILTCLPAAALCAAMLSCNVSEDESDCVVDMKLTFRFTKDGQEMFGTEVPSLSVFVFDEDDRFIERKDEYDSSKFGTDYYMPISLKPGTYRFVVWGGLDDANYRIHADKSLAQPSAPVAGQTELAKMALRLACDSRPGCTGAEKHFVDYAPGALFFGNTAQLALAANKTQTITIDLAKDSKLINLTVIGMTLPTRANDYPHMDISLDAPNGAYDFANNTIEAGCRTYTYVQRNAECEGDATQVSVISSMQMKFNRGHKLTIYNTETNADFFSVDVLDDIIAKAQAYSTQAAVDAEDEFDITIDLRSPVGAVITVNGWNVEVNGGDIQ